MVSTSQKAEISFGSGSLGGNFVSDDIYMGTGEN